MKKITDSTLNGLHEAIENEVGKMVDIDSFIDWANHGRRSFRIEYESPKSHLFFKAQNDSAYVFDYDMMMGQFVKSVDEIDLVAKRKKYLEDEIQRLENLEKKEALKNEV